jgi:NDP-sugar pyrophosphorylase family protein
MKAVLLTAGKGTRLASLDPNTPKVLLRLDEGAETLLEHQLAYLARSGMTDVAINLHHLADQVVAAVDAYTASVRVATSYEPTLLGTAGALQPLVDFLDETFVVLYADVVSDIDLASMVDAHTAHGGIATLAYYRSSEVAGKGLVTLGGDQRITGFAAKADEATEGYVNVGVYVLEPRILDYIKSVPCDFGYDVWPSVLAAGERVHGHDIGGAYLLDIGTPSALATLREDYATGAVQWRSRGHRCGSASSGAARTSRRSRACTAAASSRPRSTSTFTWS